MKIAFTGTIFFNQSYGGISRYFIELVKNLESNYKIIAPINKNIFLKKINFNNKKSLFLKKIPHYKILKKLNIFFQNKFINQYSPDIIHETYYSDSICDFVKYKKVITIYDMIHEKYLNSFYKNKFDYKKKIIDKFDYYICISEQTKNDFLNYYGVPEEKVGVTYLGGDHLLQNNSDTSAYLDEPFILYIGSREKYKNFGILLNALSKIKTKVKLICFGGENFINYTNEMRNLAINIEHVTGDDTKLVTYIKNALCFINPSLYEGFSIPNVEAMFNACPIICSDIAIFREICGNAAVYFNPNDSDQLSYLIDKVINDNFLRSKLIKEGFNRAKFFTWQNCSRDTINIYNNLCRA